MTTAVWLGVEGLCASNGPPFRWPVNTVLPARSAKDRFSLAGQVVAAAVMAMIELWR